jgi:excinuclease UvrABC nuclease subunit
VSKIRDIQTTVVDSEWEALLLENSLIKQYKPRYNSMLKDDKTYPWIAVTRESFPEFIPREIPTATVMICSALCFSPLYEYFAGNDFSTLSNPFVPLISQRSSALYTISNQTMCRSMCQLDFTRRLC